MDKEAQYQETRTQGFLRSMSDILKDKLQPEKTTCVKCGSVATVYHQELPDGTVRTWGGDRLCNSCRRKELDEQRYAQMISELPTEQNMRQELWLEQLIPVKYVLSDFENYDKSVQPVAYSLAKKYCDALGNDDDGYLCMLMMGDYGTGKTHLMMAMIKSVIEKLPKVSIRREKDGNPKKIIYPCPVEYLTEASLLKRIRDTYNSNSEISEEEVYEKLFNKSLIMIDEVGKVRPRDMSFTQSVYFNIIDHCYNNYNRLVISTNLNIQTLPEHIGGACASRLTEMCSGYIVNMKPGDYRLKKAMKQ